MSHSATSKSASLAQLGVVIAIALALIFVLAARTASVPILNLGPIRVADGTATVVGTVGSKAAAQRLTVNGQPVGVDVAGHFAASVQLNEASALDFELTGAASDQKVAFEVPLTAALLGPGGVIPAGVLDALDQAGVSLLAPLAGTNGGPFTLSGGVLDKSQLASLSVDGQDILDKLAHDGSFTVQLPGTTKVVTVKVVDKQGVSETRTTRLKQASVAASRAVGVKITKIRFFTRRAARLHRVRLVVTVKDRLGRLIRGAKISVSARPGRLSRKPRSALTGRKGKTTVGLRLREAALGKRLAVVVVARTPRAKARKTSSVRLPRAGHR
jgi:hypothetical protein